MQAKIEAEHEIGKSLPLFEMKGPLAKIDLSAWISGASYLLGISIIGANNLFTIVHQSPFVVMALFTCLALFFVAVVALQKYMGLSLRASEYGAPKQLATDGPFRFSRNPIYVAFLLPLASFAFISLTATLCAIAFYIIAMNFTVLRIEERDLVATFGDAYVDYARTTPRWIW